MNPQPKTPTWPEVTEQFQAVQATVLACGQAIMTTAMPVFRLMGEAMTAYLATLSKEERARLISNED